MKRILPVGCLWTKFVTCWCGVLALLAGSLMTASASTTAFSGQAVTDDLYDVSPSIGVPGVTVTIARAGGGPVVAATTADANGFWSAAAPRPVNPGDTYVYDVSFTKAGHTFVG